MITATSARADSFELEAVRRDIWSAANALRAAGLNPLETVEHVSVLVLLRLAESAPSGTLAELRGLSPSIDASTMYDEAVSKPHPARFFNEDFFPGLRTAVDEKLPRSPLRLIFNGFTPRVTDDRALLRSLELIERLSLNVEHIDVNGTVYEKLIGTISDAGHLGQYFTPRHIVDAMVALVRPQAGETIYDPAAGTGGFLIRAATAERDSDEREVPRVFGRELNTTARRLCLINLIIHGLDPANIHAGDSLAEHNQTRDAYDVVLTNPPFGQTVTSPEVLARFPIKSRGAEALFVQHVLRVLKPGGRAAIVCPEGLLTNVGHLRDLREWITQKAQVQAVLSLPGGVFLPYTGVRTGILVLHKGESTKKVWFFDVRADGFSLDVKRSRVPENDLPEVVRRFPRKSKSARSALVPVSELAKSDFRFVTSRYLNGRKHRPTARQGVPLGFVVELRRGTLDPSAHPRRDFFYVGLEHIESKTGQLINVERVRGAGLKSQKNRFCTGDVLYGKLRPYLAKSALAPCDGICSTEILVLMPDRAKVDGGYLAHVLRSDSFTVEASALMVGANHPRLHPRDLLSIEIPLPGIDEQQALTADLAELQAKIDDAAQAVLTFRADLAERVEVLWGG